MCCVNQDRMWKEEGLGTRKPACVSQYFVLAVLALTHSLPSWRPWQSASHLPIGHCMASCLHYDFPCFFLLSKRLKMSVSDELIRSLRLFLDGRCTSSANALAGKGLTAAPHSTLVIDNHNNNFNFYSILSNKKGALNSLCYTDTVIRLMIP